MIFSFFNSFTLHCVCAFSQYNLDVSHWPVVSRAILGVGTIIILVNLTYAALSLGLATR